MQHTDNPFQLRDQKLNQANLKPRKIVGFRSLKKSSERPKLKDTDETRIHLKGLVESPYFDVLVEAAALYKENFRQVESPNTVAGLIGFTVNSLQVDSVEKFVEWMVGEATKAPDPANYEPTDLPNIYVPNLPE